MKNSKFLLLITFSTVLFINCSNDDGPDGTNPGDNHPPGTFGLTSVEDEATEVDVKPTFIWEAATDPDGDAVTYDLYVGTESDPQNLIAENLNSTAFSLSERLSLTTEYYWKVIAKDGKGNQTQSEAVFGFSTRNITAGNLATSNAPFGKRHSHTSVLFQDKIWVIGGIDGTDLKNDVWYSNDGITWAQATANAGFSPRALHSSVVFDDKIWVIGGNVGSSILENDVWYSSDGVSWQQATASAAFSERNAFSSVMFDGKMWVIGGIETGSATQADIWSSSDGITWTQVNPNAFPTRGGAQAVVFDNKIWVLAGAQATSGGTTFYNDVWYSNDGTTWQQATANAAFSKRYLTSSVVFDGKIWLLGGGFLNGAGDFETLNDVWYSKDGINWQRATGNAAFPKRIAHSSVVKDGKIWVISGTPDGTTPLSDVWYLE